MCLSWLTLRVESRGTFLLITLKGVGKSDRFVNFLSLSFDWTFRHFTWVSWLTLYTCFVLAVNCLVVLFVCCLFSWFVELFCLLFFVFLCQLIAYVSERGIYLTVIFKMPNEDKEERKPLLQNEGRPSYNAGDYISGNDFMKLVLLVTNESYNMIGWMSYGCPSGMILWYSWLKYVVLFTYIQNPSEIYS